MKLESYLNEYSIDPGAFADRIGVTLYTLQRYMRGKRIPDKEKMPLIYAETSGKVSANDFYGLNGHAPTARVNGHEGGE